MTHLRNIFFVLSFFLISYFQCQITIAKIDSIQTQSVSKLLMRGELYKIVQLETKLRKECQKLHYKKGEIRGYLNIATVLNVMKKNKESLQMLEKAEKELGDEDDYGLKSYLYFVYGTNYNSLGLHEQAIKYFDDAFVIAHKIKDKKEKEYRLYSIYDWKRNSFEYLGIMDSVYRNERKCMKLPMPMLYITIAERHFKRKNIDSAEFYINKANELLITKQIPMEGKANVIRALGKLSIKKKDYNKALEYLISSVNITSEAHLDNGTLESYKLIAEAYNGLKLSKLENEYLKKYSVLNDRLQEEDNAAVNLLINSKDNEQAEQGKEENLIFLYIILGLVLVVVIRYFIFKFSRQWKKSKDSLMIEEVNKSESSLKRSSYTYEELIALAKQSDPSFMLKFRDSFPNLYDALILKYPDLNLNDMKLCAFLKLNFSNKQIADYDHISVRTAESKKYRLRKKLNLSRDIDLYKWINDF